MRLGTFLVARTSGFAIWSEGLRRLGLVLQGIGFGVGVEGFAAYWNQQFLFKHWVSANCLRSGQPGAKNEQT